MNRAELVRRYAAHKAAAAACEKALKDEAWRIFDEEESADTWRLPRVGKVSVSLSTPGAHVIDKDKDKFMDWVAVRYPTEVVTEVVTVRSVRNPAWLSDLLTRLIPADPKKLGPDDATFCEGDEGEIIPGVEWRPGGRYLHASITVDPQLKRQFAAAARAYVEQGVAMLAVDPPPVASPMD